MAKSGRFVVTLETESPRPNLARFLKRVLRQERLRCIDVRTVNLQIQESR